MMLVIYQHQSRLSTHHGATDIQREVGNRIKAIRQAKGVTQDQLAELAGLNRAHLYRLENGKQSMTLRTLKIIADTLGVRVRDLVGNR
jgi:transcriptional regulator with XRE-family HTH domain